MQRPYPFALHAGVLPGDNRDGLPSRSPLELHEHTIPCPHCTTPILYVSMQRVLTLADRTCPKVFQAISDRERSTPAVEEVSAQRAR
jgi:hypothetical protein